ncbi:MAG: hypothetical protein F4132_01915 [Gemmatimonadetes bacterium]|nr:hypothetical protein [Gemmatimonadota bacterium]
MTKAYRTPDGGPADFVSCGAVAGRGGATARCGGAVAGRGGPFAGPAPRSGPAACAGIDPADSRQADSKQTAGSPADSSPADSSPEASSPEDMPVTRRTMPITTVLSGV